MVTEGIGKKLMSYRPPLVEAQERASVIRKQIIDQQRILDRAMIALEMFQEAHAATLEKFERHAGHLTDLDAALELQKSLVSLRDESRAKRAELVEVVRSEQEKLMKLQGEYDTASQRCQVALPDWVAWATEGRHVVAPAPLMVATKGGALTPMPIPQPSKPAVSPGDAYLAHRYQGKP